MIKLQRLQLVSLVGALFLGVALLGMVNGYAQTKPDKTLFACGFGDKPDAALARYSGIQSNLAKAGWSIESKPLNEAMSKEGGTIWIAIGSADGRKMSVEEGQKLKEFVSNGGKILVTLGHGIGENESGKQLLRNLGIMVSGRESSPKLQQLKVPPFTGLRWFCSKTVLLDVGEEGLSRPVLVSNDTDQTPATKGSSDLAGFRIVLGNIGKGKLVVATAGESFHNESLTPIDDKLTNDNGEVFLRMLYWLRQENR